MNTNLFGEEQGLPVKFPKLQKPKTNPMIRAYGEGPEGAKCISCQHQFFRVFASKYSKCELRDVSSSPKTDHNSRYHACGKFQAKPTGNIWVTFVCKVCGHRFNPSLEKQEHHDQRMIDFGWTCIGVEEGVNIWERSMQSCYACPPKPRATKAKRR